MERSLLVRGLRSRSSSGSYVGQAHRSPSGPQFRYTSRAVSAGPPGCRQPARRPRASSPGGDWDALGRDARHRGNSGYSARLDIASVSAVPAPKPTSYAGPSERDADHQSDEVQNFPPPVRSTEAAHAGRDESCAEPDSVRHIAAAIPDEVPPPRSGFRSVLGHGPSMWCQMRAHRHDRAYAKTTVFAAFEYVLLPVPGQ